MWGHQARALQGLLHEGLAEAHPVLALRDVMEVPDVEALVLPVQRQEALHLGHRRPLGGRRAAPAVVEALEQERMHGATKKTRGLGSSV